MVSLSSAASPARSVPSFSRSLAACQGSMDDALGPTKPTSAESVSETASATHQPSFLIPSGNSVLNSQHHLARVQAELSGRTSDRASCLATMSTKTNSPANEPTSASSVEGIVTPESPVSELYVSVVKDSSGRGLQQILTSAIPPIERNYLQQAGTALPVLGRTATWKTLRRVLRRRLLETVVITRQELEEESREYTESDPPRIGRNTATGQDRPNLDYVHNVVDNLIERFSTRAVTEKPLLETPSPRSSRSRSLSMLIRKAASTKTVSSPFAGGKTTRRRSPSKRRQTTLAATPNASGVRSSLTSPNLPHDKKADLERVLSVCSLLESVTGEVTTEAKKLCNVEEKSPALIGWKQLGNSTAVVEGLCGDLLKDCTANGGKRAGSKTRSKTMDILKRLPSTKFVKAVGSKKGVKSHDSRKMLMHSGGSKQQVFLEGGEVPALVTPSFCGSVQELRRSKQEKDGGSNHTYINAARKRAKNISADGFDRTKDSTKAWDESEHTSAQKKRNVRFLTNLVIPRRESSANQSHDSEPRAFPKEAWGEVLWRQRKEEARKKAPKKILSLLGPNESMEDVETLSTEKTAVEWSGNEYTENSAAGGRAKRLSCLQKAFTPGSAVRRSMSKGIGGKAESRDTLLCEMSGGESVDLEANKDLSQDSQYSQFYPYEQKYGIDEVEGPYWEDTKSQDSLMVREGEYRTGSRTTPPADAYTDYQKNRSQDDLTSESGQLGPSEEQVDNEHPLLHSRIGRRRSRLTSHEGAQEEGGDVAQPIGEQSNVSHNVFEAGAHRCGSVRHITSDVRGTTQDGAPAGTLVPPPVRTLSRGSVRNELELPKTWSRHQPQNTPSLNPFVTSGPPPFRSTSGYEFQQRSHSRCGFDYGSSPLGSHTAMPAMLPVADQITSCIQNQQPTMLPYIPCSSPPLTSFPPPHWSRPPQLSYPPLTATAVPMDSGLRFSQPGYSPHSRLPAAWANVQPPMLTLPNVPFQVTMPQEFGLAEGTRVLPSPDAQEAPSKAISAAQCGSAATTTKHGTSQSPVSQLCPSGKQSSRISSAGVEPKTRPSYVFLYPSASTINRCSNSESNVSSTWPASSLDRLDFRKLPAQSKSADRIMPREETTFPWRFFSNTGGQIALYVILLVCALAGIATGISMYSNHAESWDATVNGGEVDGEQQPSWMSGPWVKNDAALSEESNSCRRPLCSERVARLVRSLKEGVHPCQNFYGHVCSLKRSSSAADLQQAQETEHKVVAFFKGIGSPDKDLPVAAISRRLWKDCVDLATLNRQGKGPLRALLKLADLGGWPFGAGHYDPAALPDVWKAAGKLQRLMALAPFIKIIALKDGTLWLTLGDPSGSVEVEDVLVAMMEAGRRNVSRLRALAGDVTDLSHRLAGLREHQASALEDHEQQGTDVLPEIFLESAMKGLRPNVGLDAVDAVRVDAVGLVAATVKLVSESSPQTVLNLLGYKLVRQVDLFTEAAVKADLNAGASNRESLCARAVLEDALSGDAAEYVRYAALRNEVDFDLVRSVAAELKRTLGAKLAELRWMDTSTLKSAQSRLRNIKVYATTVNR
ncbi:hypothetical protein HPB48_007371 [Haemaphysalis longicornis]|uniref:Uncharacterized protein n=1 Tax=Haemaphysalis longicornis TaxID=44386 RepID=A0A9J6G771_HAELO|nr:hypothetical protein HPB48_007371 [Haemaphysalis longicornis]